MTIRPGFAVAVLVTVHALDFVTFVVAVGLLGVPISWEQNPLMVGAWSRGGPLLVFATEVTLVAIIVAIMARVTTRSLWPPFLIGYGLGLLGATANILAINSFTGGM